jgi:hypothetical protein
VLQTLIIHNELNQRVAQPDSERFGDLVFRSGRLSLTSTAGWDFSVREAFSATLKLCLAARSRRGLGRFLAVLLSVTEMSP